MKKLAIIIAALLAAVACDEKVEYNQTLGLMGEYNKLSVDGGSTQVAVFSNTDWTVEMDHPVSWASIDRLSGHKSGYLVFDYETNYGRARRVNLIFRAGDETRTLSMYQTTRLSDDACVLDLDAANIAAPAEGMEVMIPFETNLVYLLDEMYLSFTYPEGEEPATPWITLKSVELNSITIVIAPNNTGVERRTKMVLAHTDAGALEAEEGDTVTSNTINVVQTQ